MLSKQETPGVHYMYGPGGLHCDQMIDLYTVTIYS